MIAVIADDFEDITPALIKRIEYASQWGGRVVAIVTPPAFPKRDDKSVEDRVAVANYLKNVTYAVRSLDADHLHFAQTLIKLQQDEKEIIFLAKTRPIFDERQAFLNNKIAYIVGV